MIDTQNLAPEVLSFIQPHRQWVASQAPSQSNLFAQWVIQERNRNISLFAEMGFPARKDEQWKYTDLREFKKQNFSVSQERSLASDLDKKNILPSYIQDKSIVVSFYNGCFAPDLSQNLDFDGLTIEPISRLLVEEPTRLPLNLQTLVSKMDQLAARTSNDTFAALNRSFTNDGVVLWLAANTALNQPIYFVYHYDSEEDAHVPVVFPRNFVYLESHSQASVVEIHRSYSKARMVSCGLTEVLIDEGAKLNYVKLETQGAASYHFHHLVAQVERSSQLNAFNYSDGALLSRHNSSVYFSGEGGEADLNGLYLAQGTQHVDNHTLLQHEKGQGRSYQTYKGVLTEKARAVFNGKVKIDPQAQKVDSSQLNHNLLLSEKAEVDTKPELEIYADDVKATHGATVGQLNDEQLFYFLSRGISEEQAISMLARGFVEDVILKISDKNLRRVVDNSVDSVFSKFQQRIEAEAKNGLIGH